MNNMPRAFHLVSFSLLLALLLTVNLGCDRGRIEDHSILGKPDSVTVDQSKRYVWFGRDSYRVDIQAEVKKDSVYYLTRIIRGSIHDKLCTEHVIKSNLKGEGVCYSLSH